jgi:hypothetical protein
VWRSAWRFYTRVGLPTLGRLVSREWAYTGRFLAESIPGFYERYPIARVVELWEQAGIANVQVRPMSLGGGVVMWGIKPTHTPTPVTSVAGTTAVETSAGGNARPT